MKMIFLTHVNKFALFVLITTHNLNNHKRKFGKSK